jgi:hypothetical protein
MISRFIGDVLYEMAFCKRCRHEEDRE